MEEHKKSIDFQLFARVASLALPYRTLLVTTVILAVVLAPIGIIRPWLVQVMVDDYIAVKDLSGLYRMAWIYVGVALLTVFLRYVFIYCTSLMGQSIIRDLRSRVYNHITKLSLRYFDQTPIGTSTTRTINDIESINSIFTEGMITMIADLLSIIAVMAIMFNTSWRLTLVCLSTLPLLLIATYIFKEKVKASYQIVRTQVAKMNAFLQERISGMKIVQIFNAEKQELANFKKINREYTQANLNAILYYAIFFPVVEIINYITLALLVWFGANWFLTDSVSFGALVTFPIYINMLYRPIRLLADKFNTLQMGLIAAERVFKVVDDNSQITDFGKLSPTKFIGDIQFEHVNFAYDGVNYVLNDISFEVKAGESLAIIGSTGSGKTSIINTLNRFYEIQSGNITVDGIDVKDIRLEALRSEMALVLQDVFLFTGTVMENITLRDKSISVDEVKEAARTIGADAFIDDLPDGYDYVIMERGSNLSMGQRQLISFVRALVFNPSILILDEATSSIDTETEAIIQNAIEKLIDKRTSIIIAHRLTTIRHVDNIIVLDKGRIIQQGSHSELMMDDESKYKELYEMQI